ncbi:hypothetical protein QQS21_005272 [Conoideocrella luteorostrata]|uniref:NB-ARC domain-containing protein n=1 Tax=Conoideocrella luteorostrata TaxID=1105319 RepID=A0AAJ0FZ83_9HYPO|nr:hypothetical protein QQS21_005272 [Conoideocrella luteorostrata]
MDGLSVAASVIAVVDVSVKVITLCSQYANAAANAQADIARLETHVKGLKTTLDDARALIEAPQGVSLSASRGLTDQLAGCHSTLEKLHGKLETGTVHKRKHRLWLRALKWPLSRGEIETTISALERYHRRIMDGLQIDQTTLLLHIKNGVQNSSPTNEDTYIAQKPHFILPFPQDPDFVARPVIQKWIHEQLVGTASRIALTGMGGFGKSQIAIEVAHEVHRSSPEKSVFWVHGRTKATFVESYQSLADKLALPRRHDPKVNILPLVRDWLQRDDVSPWLIILDNADEFDVFFGQTESSPLASYLPKTGNGKVLVTSRNLNVAERLTGSHITIMQLHTMSSDEAVLLLRKRLSSGVVERAATDLVRCLDCIPLAVGQAAAYINRRRISIAAYIERFQKSDWQKTGLLSHDGGDIRRHDSMSNSVAVTWKVTFEQILRESPAAANLLSLLSFFQPRNIPQYVLSGYREGLQNSEFEQISDETLEKDMDVLLAYSLINTPAEPQVYEMHSLVQICTRSWLSELGHITRWENIFVRVASEHFPSGDFETWHECQMLLPHIETTLKRQPDNEADILNWGLLLTNVTYYMLKKGDYNNAEVIAQKSVEVRKRLLGLEDPSTLESMANLAATYWNQGRWEEAEKLQVQVMETSKTRLGADHPDTLRSMGNLAATYWNQGRWEEAEKLQVQVMDTRKTRLGADHPDTLSSMANLATTYGNQGRWEEDKKLQVQVIDIRKTKLGADHPDTLSSIANLAETYRNQGQWEEAEKLQVQVMDIRKTRLGADYPDTLSSIANLATTYRNQGRWEEAEKLQVQVINTSKTRLGADHPDTLSSMANLATTYWNQGQWEEAKKLQVQVIDTSKTRLGADHPDTLRSMANLATTYWNQGRWEEAETLEVQVLETRKIRLGADHPDTLTSMNNLAYTWHRQGRQTDALKLMKECAHARQQILGADHPYTASSLNSIAEWSL